ncbi:hypothetical protein [Gordonia sp. NPDC058843]|uniref:hypothetical protein n=1 Tax=Gordonia sp. NPDC058843 TaxID=3346648 RepID=UPI0036C83528
MDFAGGPSDRSRFTGATRAGRRRFHGLRRGTAVTGCPAARIARVGGPAPWVAGIGGTTSRVRWGLATRAGWRRALVTWVLSGTARGAAAVGSTVVWGPGGASTGTGLGGASITGHRLTPVRTRPCRTARLRAPARAVGW